MAADEPARRALLTTREVAAWLGFSRSAVAAAARAGRLPAHRTLSDWRFDADEIAAYIERGRNAPGDTRVSETAGSDCLSRPSPHTERPRGGAGAGAPNPTPAGVVLFPGASWHAGAGRVRKSPRSAAN